MPAAAEHPGPASRKRKIRGVVKLDAAILRKVHAVASSRNINACDYVNGLLSGPVDRDLLAEMRVLEAGVNPA